MTIFGNSTLNGRFALRSGRPFCELLNDWYQQQQSLAPRIQTTAASLTRTLRFCEAVAEFTSWGTHSELLQVNCAGVGTDELVP